MNVKLKNNTDKYKYRDWECGENNFNYHFYMVSSKKHLEIGKTTTRKEAIKASRKELLKSLQNKNKEDYDSYYIGSNRHNFRFFSDRYTLTKKKDKLRKI